MLLEATVEPLSSGFQSCVWHADASGDFEANEACDLTDVRQNRHVLQVRPLSALNVDAAMLQPADASVGNAKNTRTPNKNNPNDDLSRSGGTLGTIRFNRNVVVKDLFLRCETPCVVLGSQLTPRYDEQGEVARETATARAAELNLANSRLEEEAKEAKEESRKAELSGDLEKIHHARNAKSSNPRPVPSFSEATQNPNAAKPAESTGWYAPQKNSPQTRRSTSQASSHSPYL